MGWLNYHLHEFGVGDARNGMLDPEWSEPGDKLIDEVGVSLAEMIGEVPLTGE